MKRRKFIAGAGGVSLGGSGLIGSGAFSRAESNRRLSVAVAEDENAYLGLEPCDSLHGDNFVDTDDNGHLEIDMSPENTVPAGGEGINSNSESFFDDVFQIRNQGKEKVCVWIDAEVEFDETSVPVVDFYVFDGEGNPRTIRGVEASVGLDTGESFCVGIRTYTRNLTEGDRLLKDDKITVNADVDPDDEIDCPQIGDGEIPPIDDDDPVAPDRAISWVAFCGSDLDENDISPSVETTDDDGDPLTVLWDNVDGLETVVIFGAAQMWRFDPGDSPAGVGTEGGTQVTWVRGGGDPSPSQPCPNGECGPKFDWNGTFAAESHQDECNDDD